MSLSCFIAVFVTTPLPQATLYTPSHQLHDGLREHYLLGRHYFEVSRILRESSTHSVSPELDSTSIGATFRSPVCTYSNWPHRESLSGNRNDLMALHLADDSRYYWTQSNVAPWLDKLTGIIGTTHSPFFYQQTINLSTTLEIPSSLEHFRSRNQPYPVDCRHLFHHPTSSQHPVIKIKPSLRSANLKTRVIHVLSTTIPLRWLRVAEKQTPSLIGENTFHATFLFIWTNQDLLLHCLLPLLLISFRSNLSHHTHLN